MSARAAGMYSIAPPLAGRPLQQDSAILPRCTDWKHDRSNLHRCKNNIEAAFRAIHEGERSRHRRRLLQQRQCRGACLLQLAQQRQRVVLVLAAGGHPVTG